MKIQSRILCSIFLLLNVCILVAGCDRKHGQEVSPGKAAAGPAQLVATIGNQYPLVTDDTASGSPVVFNSQGTAVAYVTGKVNQYRLVYNGKAENEYQKISDITFSPDGRRLAYTATKNNKRHLVVDGKEGMTFDAVGAPIFSRDSKHVLYYAQSGVRWYLVVDEKKNAGAVQYQDQFFSEDSSRIIAIEQAESGIDSIISVCDLALKPVRKKQVLAYSRIYNKDKSRMAAISEANGKKRVIELSFDNIDAITQGPLYDDVSLPGFGPDDRSVAYAAIKGGKGFVIVNGNVIAAPAGTITEAPAVRPGNKDAGLIVASAAGSVVYPSVAKQEPSKRYDEAAYLTFNAAGTAYVAAVKSGNRQLYLVNGNESPAFDRILTPKFTPDGNHVIGRVRLDGKRFIVLLDIHGRMVKRCPHYEMVFEPEFSADGRSFVYGAKDNDKLVWITEKLP